MVRSAGGLRGDDWVDHGQRARGRGDAAGSVAHNGRVAAHVGMKDAGNVKLRAIRSSDASAVAQHVAIAPPLKTERRTAASDNSERRKSAGGLRAANGLFEDHRRDGRNTSTHVGRGSIRKGADIAREIADGVV